MGNDSSFSEQRNGIYKEVFLEKCPLVVAYDADSSGRDWRQVDHLGPPAELSTRRESPGLGHSVEAGRKGWTPELQRKQ